MLPKLQEKVQCVREERKLNFGNEITEILVVLLALLEMETNCGNVIAESGWKKKKKIVATKLPKMKGGEKKKRDATSHFSQQITDG